MLDQIPPCLLTSAAASAQFKLKLVHAIGLNVDLLHLHFGMPIACLAALAPRRKPTSLLPWLVLLVLECSNEAADLMLDGMGSPEATWGAGLQDLLNAMFVPTLLLVG